MHSFTHIDFTNSRPPLFAGDELRLTGELTIFGRDLPDFRKWAMDNGATGFSIVEKEAEYLARTHELVAHEYPCEISLNEMGTIRESIEPLMERAKRLALFVHIKEQCTCEEIRKAMRGALSNHTFRILYPRGTFSKRPGIKLILVEQRRPCIFLFLSGAAMSGKTETALLFCGNPDTTIIHGDEYFHAILSGEIEVDDGLREGLVNLTQGRAAPDLTALARFLELIPDFDKQKDLILDFFIPYQSHFQVAQFFHEIGFFPILCLTPNDQTHLAAKEAAADDAYRRQEELHKKEKDALINSTSWRITAPLRALGRLFPKLVAAGRSLFRW